MIKEFCLFSGTANEELGEAIAQLLGIRLGPSEVSRFRDGEISVRLLEPVRRN